MIFINHLSFEIECFIFPLVVASCVSSLSIPALLLQVCATDLRSTDFFSNDQFHFIIWRFPQMYEAENSSSKRRP